MTPIDREALERAIELERGKGSNERLRINRMIEDDGLEAAGEFASYSCQIDALHLMPWQNPPSSIDPKDLEDILADGPNDDDLHGNHAAAVLLKRLFDARLSRWEPNPALALLLQAKLPPAPAK